jgi:hypothetical protein
LLAVSPRATESTVILRKLIGPADRKRILSHRLKAQVAEQAEEAEQVEEA